MGRHPFVSTGLSKSARDHADDFILTFQPILDGMYENPPTLRLEGGQMTLRGARGMFPGATLAWPPWTGAPQFHFDVTNAFTESFVRLRDEWDKSGFAILRPIERTDAFDG